MYGHRYEFKRNSKNYINLGLINHEGFLRNNFFLRMDGGNIQQFLGGMRVRPDPADFQGFILRWYNILDSPVGARMGGEGRVVWEGQQQMAENFTYSCTTTDQ